MATVCVLMAVTMHFSTLEQRPVASMQPETRGSRTRSPCHAPGLTTPLPICSLQKVSANSTNPRDLLQDAQSSLIVRWIQRWPVAQCDQQVTVVCRLLTALGYARRQSVTHQALSTTNCRLFIALATVDVPWSNFCKCTILEVKLGNCMQKV